MDVPVQVESAVSSTLPSPIFVRAIVVFVNSDRLFVSPPAVFVSPPAVFVSPPAVFEDSVFPELSGEVDGVTKAV